MSDISNEEVIRRFNEMCVNHAVKRHEEKSKHEDSNKTIKPCAEAIITEQLEAQSRAAIKAWCDDPSVEIEATSKNLIEWWNVKESKGIFTTLDCHYRIAKPKKFYRVGKFKDGLPFIIYEEGEEYWQSQPNFEEWLDERKYYD